MKFVHPDSDTLLFVKPKPHASSYFKMLRGTGLKTLKMGAEVRSNPYQNVVLVK